MPLYQTILLFLAVICSASAAVGQPITDFPGTYYETVGSSVAKITTSGKVATAWVVGPRLVITNQHVVSNAREGAAASLAFRNGDAYNDLVLLRLDIQKDFALLRVNDAVWDAAAHPPLPLDLKPRANQVLYVIGYPGGGDMRVSRTSADPRDNDLAINPELPAGTLGLGHIWGDGSGILQATCLYGVDTQFGNSGSPVLTVVDGVHRVVALHANPGSGAWLFDIIPDIAYWLPPTKRGALYFGEDTNRIPNASDISVSLLDADLAGIGSTLVSITTDGGDAESLSLVESTVEPGRFTETFNLSEAAGLIVGDGALQVASMDRVIVRYTDADGGSGSVVNVVAVAPVDRREHTGWYYNPRGDAMSRVAVELTPGLNFDNRYMGRLMKAPDLASHQQPISKDLDRSESVQVDLVVPLSFYGRTVHRIWVEADGTVAIDSPGNGQWGLDGGRIAVLAGNATARVSITNDEAGLSVTWVRPVIDSDNADVGPEWLCQLRWLTDGRIILQYGDIPSSIAGAIGLVDGFGAPVDFTPTDFSALPTIDNTSGPLIVQHPHDQTVRSFYPLHMSVRATGTGELTYQWFYNGAAVQGATGADYFAFSNPAPGSYHAVVTDDTGSTESRSARFRVSSSRQITIRVRREGEWDHSPNHGWADFVDPTAREWWRVEELFSVNDYVFTPVAPAPVGDG